MGPDPLSGQAAVDPGGVAGQRRVGGVVAQPGPPLVASARDQAPDHADVRGRRGAGEQVQLGRHEHVARSAGEGLAGRLHLDVHGRADPPDRAEVLRHELDLAARGGRAPRGDRLAGDPPRAERWREDRWSAVAAPPSGPEPHHPRPARCAGGADGQVVEAVAIEVTRGHRGAQPVPGVTARRPAQGHPVCPAVRDVDAARARQVRGGAHREIREAVPVQVTGGREAFAEVCLRARARPLVPAGEAARAAGEHLDLAGAGEGVAVLRGARGDVGQRVAVGVAEPGDGLSEPGPHRGAVVQVRRRGREHFEVGAAEVELHGAVVRAGGAGRVVARNTDDQVAVAVAVDVRARDGGAEGVVAARGYGPAGVDVRSGPAEHVHLTATPGCLGRADGELAEAVTVHIADARDRLAEAVPGAVPGPSRPGRDRAGRARLSQHEVDRPLVGARDERAGRAHDDVRVAVPVDVTDPGHGLAELVAALEQGPDRRVQLEVGQVVDAGGTSEPQRHGAAVGYVHVGGRHAGHEVVVAVPVEVPDARHRRAHRLTGVAVERSPALVRGEAFAAARVPPHAAAVVPAARGAPLPGADRHVHEAVAVEVAAAADGRFAVAAVAELGGGARRHAGVHHGDVVLRAGVRADAAEREVRSTVPVGVPQAVHGRADPIGVRRRARDRHHEAEGVCVSRPPVDRDLAVLLAAVVRGADADICVAVPVQVAEARDGGAELVARVEPDEVLDAVAQTDRVAQVQPHLAAIEIPLGVGRQQVWGAVAVDVTDLGQDRADTVVGPAPFDDLGPHVEPGRGADEDEDRPRVVVAAVVAGRADRDLAVAVAVPVAERRDGGAEHVLSSEPEDVERADAGVDPGGATAEHLDPARVGAGDAVEAWRAEHDVGVAVSVDVSSPRGGGAEPLVVGPEDDPIWRGEAAGPAVEDPDRAVRGAPELLRCGHEQVVVPVPVYVAGGGEAAADLDRVAGRRHAAFEHGLGVVYLDPEGGRRWSVTPRREAADDEQQGWRESPRMHPRGS